MAADDRVSYEDLMAFANGDLHDEAAHRVQRHLDQNVEDARTVARFKLASQHMQAAEYHDPPADSVDRAKRVLRDAAADRISTGSSLSCWVDAIVARLTFDSRLQPLAVRGAGMGDAIQLSYEVDDLEVALRAECKEDESSKIRWELMGQVSTALNLPAEAEIVVAEAGTDRIVGRARLDDYRMFSIELPDGCFDLAVPGQNGVIVLPELLLE